MKKETYLREVNHYVIEIDRNDYWFWREKITTNQPLEPSIVGYLFGKARPFFTEVSCEICKKPILEKDQHKEKPNTIGDAFRSKYPMHEKCYDRIEKEKTL